MKPVLLVIDMQKKFFGTNPVMTQSLNDAVENINQAIALFREKGFPIIAVQHMDENNDLTPGNVAFELPDGLNVLPSDVHIHKRYSNSFNKTLLADELQKRDVDTVIVSGFCAEYCVLSAYRGAEDNDLKSYILQEASASSKAENIRFVESISDTISFSDLQKEVS